MANIKTGIAALGVIAALGMGGYEGLVSDGPQDTPLANEIVASRTANSEHIRLADGKALAHVYTQPIHFKNDKGKWKQIDTTLRPKPIIRRLLSPRPYEVTSGVYVADFAETKEYNYKFADNGASVLFEARFDTSKAVSIGIETTRSGIKETIVLSDDSAPTRLEWGLTVDGTIQEVTGGFGVYNSDGQLGFLIRAANARDAKGKELPVKTMLEKDVLVAEVDTTGAVYPITVDPTVQVTDTVTNSGNVIKGSTVTFLGARDATSGDAITSDMIMVGMRDSLHYDTWNVWRSFMSFPIPSSINAVSACSLYVYGNTDNSLDNFGIYLVGAKSYGNTLTTADFKLFNGWQSSGAYNGTILNNTWNTSSFLLNDWNKIVFASAGLDSLKLATGDTLRICMISKEDYDNSEPTWAEYVTFINAYISFTYTVLPVLATNFTMNTISKDSMLVSWGGSTSINDSLILQTSPDSVFVSYLTPSATSARIGNLNPYTKYRWRIKSLASGGALYSNADSMYTCQTFKTENFDLFNNGTVRNNATAVYDSARGEIKADSLVATATIDTLGQRKYGTDFTIFRSYHDVILPTTSWIRADTLFLYSDCDSSVTDFTVNAYSGKWNAGTAATSKYFTFNGWQSQMTAYNGAAIVTAKNTSGWTTGPSAPNRLNFTTAGRDSLVARSAAGDTFRFILLSSLDIAATAPSNAGFVSILQEVAYKPYIKLTYAPPDSAPSGFTLTSISTDSLLATWVDHSYSERGFIVVDATTGVKVAGSDTTEAEIEALRIGGLLPNTSYTWKVKAVGGAADGLTSATADSCYTRAAIPGKPTLTLPAYAGADSIMKIVIDVNGNPAYTEFAIQDSVSGKYVDQIGAGVVDTLKSTADWHTYAVWGGAAGCSLKVGVGKTYTIRVKAKSGQ
ncbi:MAG: fibronectin type III domain-containing protein [Candidatus Omnitrophica bacterium]|nr:fibronectin type III domain-containing protein [Candidatus Omnitrophota bacterium]